MQSNKDCIDHNSCITDNQKQSVINTDTFVSEEQFVLFRERYLRYAESGFLGCDKEIIPTLQELNKYEGVSTVHCCAGHIPGTSTEHPKRKLKNRPCYIMCAVTNRGFDRLLSLFNRYHQIVNTYTKDIQYNRLKIGASFGILKRTYPFEDSRSLESAQYYTAIIIQYTASNESDLINFRDLLYKAAVI